MILGKAFDSVTTEAIIDNADEAGVEDVYVKILR